MYIHRVIKFKCENYTSSDVTSTWWISGSAIMAAGDKSEAEGEEDREGEEEREGEALNVKSPIVREGINTPYTLEPTTNPPELVIPSLHQRIFYNNNINNNNSSR